MRTRGADASGPARALSSAEVRIAPLLSTRSNAEPGQADADVAREATPEPLERPDVLKGDADLLRIGSAWSRPTTIASGPPVAFNPSRSATLADP
jgi:hypothetical protein